MTHREILDAMGSSATDAEAEAMARLLTKRGITSLDEISNEDFFALIPDAIELAGYRTA